MTSKTNLPADTSDASDTPTIVPIEMGAPLDTRLPVEQHAFLGNLLRQYFAPWPQRLHIALFLLEKCHKFITIIEIYDRFARHPDFRLSVPRDAEPMMLQIQQRLASLPKSPVDLKIQGKHTRQEYILVPRDTIHALRAAVAEDVVETTDPASHSSAREWIKGLDFGSLETSVLKFFVDRQGKVIPLKDIASRISRNTKDKDIHPRDFMRSLISLLAQPSTPFGIVHDGNLQQFIFDEKKKLLGFLGPTGGASNFRTPH